MPHEAAAFVKNNPENRALLPFSGLFSTKAAVKLLRQEPVLTKHQPGHIFQIVLKRIADRIFRGVLLPFPRASSKADG